MHMDIVELRAWYHSELGRRAAQTIGLALSRIWEPVANERLLGLGYTRPWLERFEPDTDRTMSFMLANHGAARWPRTGPSKTALVFDEELPLADAAVDRILMVHVLEHAENPRETLMEMWRVLAPNGRLVIVVPNRQGVWARVESTPFGTGRPYSRSQIVRLLRETNFTATAETEALFFPPSRRFLTYKLSGRLEAIGLRLWPMLSGVLIIEAQKRLFEGLPVTERQSRRVFVPVFAPQGSAAGRVNRNANQE
ncbi:MAG: class I SAM-dependent methyltransferase [Pseudomonadota bacterium]